MWPDQSALSETPEDARAVRMRNDISGCEGSALAHRTSRLFCRTTKAPVRRKYGEPSRAEKHSDNRQQERPSGERDKRADDCQEAETNDHRLCDDSHRPEQFVPTIARILGLLDGEVRLERASHAFIPLAMRVDPVEEP